MLREEGCARNTPLFIILFLEHQMNNLCQFSIDKSQGLEVKLCCNIDNQVCGFYRYCVSKKSIVMRDTYIDCPKRSDQMGRPKKVTEEIQNTEENTVLSPTENLETEDKIETIEETPRPQKQKTQKQPCKVFRKTSNKIYIDFKGYGFVRIDNTPLEQKTNNVEVTYKGEINIGGFEIISHKFI
jgi:hypothetical protein